MTSENHRMRPLFDGKQWPTFKFSATIDLRAENAYQIATGEEERPVAAAQRRDWDTRHAKGLRILKDSISNDVCKMLIDRETLPEVWAKLLEVYENNTPRNRFKLIRSCLSFKYDASKSVQENISNLNLLISACNAINDPISDHQKMSILLSTLPKVFESIGDTFETLPVEQQTTDMLTSMLLRKEASKAITDTNSTNESEERVEAVQALYNRTHGNRQNDRRNGNPSFKRRFNGRCNNCHGHGHRASNCNQRPANNNNYNYRNSSNSSRQNNQSFNNSNRNNFNRNNNYSNNDNYNNNGNDYNNSGRAANFDHNFSRDNGQNNNYNRNNNNANFNRNLNNNNDNDKNFRQRGNQSARNAGLVAIHTGADSDEPIASLTYKFECKTDCNSESKALAVCASSVDSEEWIGDSGASRHMTPNKTWFNTYKPLSKGKMTVIVGNGNPLNVDGVGTVEIITDENQVLTLRDVLHVPLLSFNLFSLMRTARSGLEVKMFYKDLTIKEGNDTLLTGVAIDESHYTMNFNVLKSFKANVAIDSKLSITQWHERLGHANYNTIKQMINQNRVNGMKCHDFSIPGECIPCVKNKLTRSSFKQSYSRANEPGELIHFDIMGPYEIRSIGHACYLAAFVDDMSGMLFVYPLKTKDEIKSAILKLIAKVKRTGIQIRRMRSDNALEFRSKELNDIFDQNQIYHEFSAPYCPEQNGRAEDKIAPFKK